MGFYASADEETHTPWLWSLREHHVVQRLQPHPDPVHQIAVGEDSNGVCQYVASISESMLHLNTVCQSDMA
jgi:hypothetical protein